jgi:ribonuclease HII
VGFASAQEIDALGILPATRLAVMRALSPQPHSQFTIQPIPTEYPADFLLTDYLVLPEIEVPQLALIHGDQLSLSIAAASVLAKTARDGFMRELDARYPGYGFAQHKGYGTAAHRAAIRNLGPCPEHRTSFTLLA